MLFILYNYERYRGYKKLLSESSSDPENKAKVTKT